MCQTNQLITKIRDRTGMKTNLKDKTEEFLSCDNNQSSGVREDFLLLINDLIRKWKKPYPRVKGVINEQILERVSKNAENGRRAESHRQSVNLDKDLDISLPL